MPTALAHSALHAEGSCHDDVSSWRERVFSRVVDKTKCASCREVQVPSSDSHTSYSKVVDIRFATKRAGNCATLLSRSCAHAPHGTCRSSVMMRWVEGKYVSCWSVLVEVQCARGPRPSSIQRQRSPASRVRSFLRGFLFTHRRCLRSRTDPSAHESGKKCKELRPPGHHDRVDRGAESHSCKVLD